MTQKLTLITGGSRGIGYAVARELARNGQNVVIVGQTEESALAGQARLAAEGVTVHAFGCDVADPVQVAELATKVAALGDVEILINSAAVMSERTAKTLKTTTEEWNRVMGINLDGVFHMVAAFATPMTDRRSGRIINVSACLGRMSGPGTSGGLAPYRISKAAVNALTKNLAAETNFGKRGVFVDAMCPNHTRTDMGGPDAPRSPEEAADTIVWLATRDTVDVDGNVVETGLLWEDRQIVPW
jgi:NAD(P)-dependent dehydrogenase (short-subunit alcohol dehydrogenase family)